MSRKIALVGLVLLSLSAIVSAQPAIGAGGILNGASFRLPDAPGGGVAAGSIISIFGTNLATSTAAASAVPLPFTLNGTSVTIQGRPAALYFVSAGQINAQVPWATTAGTVPVVVTVNGTASAAANLTVQTASPGIFSQASSGRGPGAIQNFVSQTSTPLNTPTTSIAPGGLIIIYATGLGAVNNPPADGAASNGQTTSNAVTVRIGAGTVTPEFAGLSPGFVGLYQVNVRIPSTLPEGCNIAVQLQVAGQVSNTATLSSARSGNCTTLPTETTASPGGSVGALSLLRTNSTIAGLPPIPGFNLNTVSGGLAGSFIKYGPVVASSQPVPPVDGGCIVDITKSDAAASQAPASTFLDAGALTYTPAGGAAQPVPLLNIGTYYLGVSATNLTGITINPGTHTVRGAGGTQVGPFTATVNVPAVFNGRTDISGTNFSQAAGFLVSWDACPDPNGSVTVFGASVDSGRKLQGTFFCSVSCAARTYRVDPSVLRQLPLSSNALAFVYIYSYSTISRFNATGIDAGYFVYADISAFTGLTMVP